MLRFVHRLFFVRQPSNRSRVEQELRTAERRESRRFRKPLVPTNERTEFSIGSVVSLKAEIAGSEIKLLVIKRIVRDVHLAILPGDLAVAVDYDGGVVINAGGALFE